MRSFNVRDIAQEQFNPVVLMAATLCIQIHSEKSLAKEEIEFFSAGEWSRDTELQLVQQLHALLSIIRPLGISINLTLDVSVTDDVAAKFLIQRKIQTGTEINTHKLSVREIEVLGLIMQGYTNNQIAEKLFISFETVKSHRKNILLKSGAKNTALLISHYHQTFFDK